MPIDTDLTALIVALPLAWALLVIVMREMNPPSNDERENMTQEQWDEMRLGLDRHLTEVEERFWESVRIGGR